MRAINAKDEFITDLAHTTIKRGKTLTGSQVAVTVKRGRHVTDAGAPYVVGARGIYTYLDCLYDRLEAAGRQDDADAVAGAFTKEDGTYAWQARADRAAGAKVAREARLKAIAKARSDETHTHL